MLNWLVLYNNDFSFKRLKDMVKETGDILFKNFI